MRNTRLFLLLVLFFLIAKSSAAQSSIMEGMEMGPTPGNIYLKMMDSMMVNMDKTPHASTVGNEFLSQMIPHHYGALAMAGYEIENGTDFKVKQIARSIAAEQKSEIMLMKGWLTSAEPVTDSVTRRYLDEMSATMSKMMTDMPENSKLDNADRAFEQVMIPHHQAAIDMARVLLKYSRNKSIRAYATQLISNEELEIEQMKGL
ncbi:MAG: DUF305 domain-containing protein [Bacteroidota bacterium]